MELRRINIVSWIYATIAAAALCLFCSVSSVAQDSDKEYVDSILALITPQTPDTTKARLYHDIALHCYAADIVKKYGWLSLRHCAPEDTMAQAGAYSCIIWACQIRGEAREAIRVAHKALSLCGDVDKFQWPKLNFLTLLSACYDDVNQLDSSLWCQNQIIDVSTRLGDFDYLCYGYFRLINLCLDRHFDEASVEFIDSLEAVSKRHNLYHHIAQAYYLRSVQQSHIAGDTVSILLSSADNLRTSLAIYDTLQLPPGVASLYHSVLLHGQSLYQQLADLTGDERYADTCYLFYEKIGTWYKDNGFTDYIIQQNNYCNYLLMKNRPKDALKAIKDCEPFLKDSIHQLFRQMYHNSLANCYYALGDYSQALANRKMGVEYQMLVNNENTTNLMSDFRAVVYARQRSKLDEIERARIEMENRYESHHSKIILYITIGGLVLFIAAVGFLFRTFVLKRRTNGELFVKNSLLSQQREEIEVQRDVLSSQQQGLEKINRNIMASVNYAQRIQHAAMLSDDDFKRIFPESFLFFRPKSIVSGDFYYAAEIEGYKVMVLADCTGHGIPGGFLSMLGIFGLKEFLHSVDDANNPASVLDKMKLFVTNSLASEQTDLSISDGMDMVICSFAPDGKTMKFASANQTAIVISDGKIIRLVGDSMSVGKDDESNVNFTNTEVSVKKDDMVYLFSDGIYEQKGGAEQDAGKSIPKADLEGFFTKISVEDIENQYKSVVEHIDGWCNVDEQTDDMSLIGIKV